jgi:ferric-dicitrate binding protein FerR (iron transport regulator)
MTQPHDNNGTGPEERIDRDLNEALRTRPLSAEALTRIQAAVQKEWTDLHAGSQRSISRRRVWVAVAAGICSIALILAWLTRTPPTPVLFGSISRIENGETVVGSKGVQGRSVRVGDPIRPADVLTAHGIGLVSLPAGSNLRIGAETVINVLGQSDIELVRGMIYVDHPPAAAATSLLRVHTRAGTIEHVGTAFEVFSSEQIVRVRVREGEVRLRNAGHDILAEAGTEIVATSDGVISHGSVPLNGEQWRWVSSMAPAYEIEGRPLLDFLEFESRELGYRLVFADPRAKQVAERTILHGTVRGREPLDAVSSVLATTSLTYSIRGNTLQVQSSDGT